jgi:2-isopropylmalate synthase
VLKIKRIQIFDTTLRDGEQTPGVNLNKLEKLEIAKQLARLGVDVMEVGFPVASPGDFESVKLIAQTIKGVTITGLSRSLKSDVDRAWEALQYAEKPRIHVFIATSKIHMMHKLNMSEEQVLEKAVEIVKYAKSLCPSIEFSPEDATRTEPEFLYKVIEAVIDAGADVINIPDTVGYSVPQEFGNLIANIKRNVPNIDKAIISVHCHNDLGLAVANSLAALENGALQVETTINGLGERAGNASLEELVMAIRTKSSYYNMKNNIVTEQINNTSMMVRNLTGVEVQINKAIVGKNAFAHESGIHQHGVLNCRETYEIMTPESVGIKKNSVVLGKHSGSHAFEQRLQELGIEDLDASQVKELFAKFKDLADRKKEVLDEDIEALVRHTGYDMGDEGYALEYFHISSGNRTMPTSTVKIRRGEESFEDAANGDGAVDSIFKAIDRAIDHEVSLKDYSLKSITSGKDALGEVTVKVEGNGRIYNGRGVSTDIIEASAKAYINAINRMLYSK